MTCNRGEPSSIPGSGRSAGEGKGYATHSSILGLPWWLSWYKESTFNVGDLGSISGLGRSHGEGNGNPLQYSCLENPMEGRLFVCVCVVVFFPIVTFFQLFCLFETFHNKML